MKLTKVVTSGIVLSIFSAIFGMITCGNIFNWVYKLEPTSIWKSFEGSPPPAFFMGVFILNILFALTYAVFFKGIPAKTKPMKGFVFGLCVWMVGILPGMFSTYTFMNVAAGVIVYWTIIGLIETMLKGMIVAGIYGD